MGTVFDLQGTGPNATWSYAYNPASQLSRQERVGDAYAWTGYADVDRSYAANGLNQYTAVAGAAHTYDANGNLTGDGANSYGYDVENRLLAATGAHTAALGYDPLGRLWRVSGSGGVTTFVHDGDALVAEYDGSGALLRQYSHGAGDDTPVHMLDHVAGRNLFLHGDRQGSIVAVTNVNTTAPVVNAYDEYGIPKAGNGGRFQYTGQAWLAELGLYYYKARMYAPTAAMPPTA